MELTSFFEGGVRLITTTSRGNAWLDTAVATPATRLVQLRPGGRPLALDGQHVGTVKAWMGGGRQSLPATAEALTGYLEADRRLLREGLKHRGSLTLRSYILRVFGKPPGVLRF